MGGWVGGGAQSQLAARRASPAPAPPTNAPHPCPPPRSRASDVRGVMEQNREMLAERGERLRQLNDRSEVLQGDAEDFASNAKRLADMYSNRKWWQL